MKNAPRKLDVRMSAAMPCKIQREKYKDIALKRSARQNTLALLMNLQRNAWKHKNYEDHFTAEGHSLRRYNLVHKFIPTP